MPQYTEEELASLEKSVPDVTGMGGGRRPRKAQGRRLYPFGDGDGQEVLEQVPQKRAELAQAAR